MARTLHARRLADHSLDVLASAATASAVSPRLHASCLAARAMRCAASRAPAECHRGMTSPGTDELERETDGSSAPSRIGENVAFLLLYLLLLPFGLSGGRGVSCFGLCLVPVLLLHTCFTAMPAIRGVRKLVGARRQVARLTTIGSLLVGSTVAALFLMNESGC